MLPPVGAASRMAPWRRVRLGSPDLRPGENVLFPKTCWEDRPVSNRCHDEAARDCPAADWGFVVRPADWAGRRHRLGLRARAAQPGAQVGHGPAILPRLPRARLRTRPALATRVPAH